MDILRPVLPLTTLTAMSLLCVLSYEVKVSSDDIRLCKEVCVTDQSDCDLQLPSSVQNPLNMSCYFEKFTSPHSVTCEWSQETDSHTESDVSLILSSKNQILSCWALLTTASIINITVRIRSYNMDREIWSQLPDVFLGEVVKPSTPVLKALQSTEDSVVVSWNNSDYSSCRLRYRGGDTQSWSQDSDLDVSGQNLTLSYTITGLLPFNSYSAAVACSEESNIWSRWSSEVQVKTLDRAPCTSPEVCYRVDGARDSSGPLVLHLMWKALDPRDARGSILGYQVSYRLAKTQLLQDGFILNTSEVSASLEVKAGEWNVTVRAFNTAGYGPAAHLSIDTETHNYVPSLTNMWVSSSFPAVKHLMVEWKIPPARPVSRFDVRWHTESHPSTSRWSSVDGSTSSVHIQDLDVGKLYLITVVPVYKQQCGCARSLPASLQQGALMEPDNLRVIEVTTATVTVGWVWQSKSGAMRVGRYRAMLRTGRENQSALALTLWPNQTRHTFFNLSPSTDYSLLLLADEVYRSITTVTTDFDKVPVVATATPLLLLAVTVFVASILSRTVYKWYFFPHISSPQGSTTGRWLMDPNRQNSTETSILDIKDFQDVEVLGVTGAVLLGPNPLLSSEEDPHEDGSLLPLALKLSDICVDTEYVFNGPASPERPPHHQTSFAQREDEDALKGLLHQLIANVDRSCADPMICEGDYVLNSSPVASADIEKASGHTDCSALICDTDYIANSCFAAKTALEIGAS